MKKYHDVRDLSFTETTMKITIDDKKYEFDLNQLSPRLKSSKQSDRQKYEISPSGYGIHWPTIDEDLSIDGLLEIIHRPPRRIKSLTYK